MTVANDTPERAAANWFIALREAPDDAYLRARFESWLAADACHAAKWAEINETSRFMAAADLARRSSALLPPHRSRRRWWMPPPGTLWKTASVAALIGGLALALAPDVVLWVRADHISGTGEVATIRLQDGSVVDLGPDSAITINYSGEARAVRLLAGRAMFEIRHDRYRPFRVLSDDVETRVLGTGFEVGMQDGTTSVAVRYGHVRVTAGTAQTDLTAGNWTRVYPDRRMIHGTRAAVLVGAWRSGRISVQDRPIADVIDEMRPWYSGKIILADSTLGARTVTGTYDFRNAPRSLNLLVSTYGGRVIQVTPWLQIVTGI